MVTAEGVRLEDGGAGVTARGDFFAVLPAAGERPSAALAASGDAAAEAAAVGESRSSGASFFAEDEEEETASAGFCSESAATGDGAGCFFLDGGERGSMSPP